MSDVQIRDLRKSFGSAQVLHGVDLDVVDGECVALLGPSGCGKTTLLRSLSGLERPDSGTIRIDGTTVDDRIAGIHLPTQKRNLGLVFQNYALWPHMTVFDNVAYPLRVRRTRQAQLRERVAEYLALVGLEGFEDRPSMSLSGGQQQRVALARALVSSPSVLLLDEPLSNLDAQRRRQLRAELRRIRREVRTTTVYVTHDQIEALTLADRVYLLNEGVVEQTGTPHQVFTRPVSRFVAEFLGFENFLTGTVTRVHGGAVTVNSPHWGGELRSTATTTVSVGDSVELAVRASSLRVVPGSDVPASGTTSASVSDISYLGDSYEYTLVRGDRSLTLRSNEARDVPVDAVVHLDAEPQDVVLLAR